MAVIFISPLLSSRELSCRGGMAPMLCALFLAARMRALQMDPLHGHPQKWAQNCFYACSVALVVHPTPGARARTL